MVDSKFFHGEARDFFSRSDERAKNRAKGEIVEKEEKERVDKKRSRIHFWWLALLSGLIVAGFTAILGWAINFEQTHKISQDHRISSSVQLPTNSQIHEDYHPDGGK